jgi:hypothetical protein
VQELLEAPVVQGIVVLQLARLVIGLDKIFDNGARLPKSEARVGVKDGRQAAIGVDGHEVVGLGIGNLGLIDCNGISRSVPSSQTVYGPVGAARTDLLVRYTELLEDDENLEGVGGTAGCKLGVSFPTGLAPCIWACRNENIACSVGFLTVRVDVDGL